MDRRSGLRAGIIILVSGAAVAICAFAASPSAPKASPADGELAEAQRILAVQLEQHPILKGTTVEFGPTLGEQAVAHYREGRIVLSRTHGASLERIIEHEVWHIIDWRDNGRIDWGDSVPAG